MKKKISRKTHGFIATHFVPDVASGIFAAGAPSVFEFADDNRAKNFFPAAGASGIAAGLLSLAANGYLYPINNRLSRQPRYDFGIDAARTTLLFSGNSG